MDAPDVRIVAIKQTGASRYLLTATKAVHMGDQLLSDLLILERVLWRLGLTVTGSVPPAVWREYQLPGVPLAEPRMPDSVDQFWAVRPSRDVPLPTVQAINEALGVYRPPQMQVLVTPLSRIGYVLVVCDDEDDHIGQVAEQLIAGVDGVEQILAGNDRPQELRGFRAGTARVARIGLPVNPESMTAAISGALGLLPSKPR